jgi:hypothetical protein
VAFSSLYSRLSCKARCYFEEFLTTANTCIDSCTIYISFRYTHCDCPDTLNPVHLHS